METNEIKESNQYGWKTSKLTGESSGAQYDEKNQLFLHLLGKTQ